MICKTINANAKAKEIRSEHPLINQFPIPSLLHFASSLLSRADMSAAAACNRLMTRTG